MSSIDVEIGFELANTEEQESTDNFHTSDLDEGHSGVEPESAEPNQDQQIIHELLQRSQFELVLRRAAATFPHLDKAISSRESPALLLNRVKINAFDFDAQSLLCTPKERQTLPFEALSRIPPNVRQRVIIIEDLSRPYLFGLGDHFGVSPEFFEEHLLNSGYGMIAEHYNEPPSTTWPTAHLPKSHSSIKWYRPVELLPTPFSSHDRSTMLAEGVKYKKSDGTNGTARAGTNICRREWGLRADPATTTQVKRNSLLEERASIWRRNLDSIDCQVVILLLDPVPTYTETYAELVPTENQEAEDVQERGGSSSNRPRPREANQGKRSSGKGKRKGIVPNIPSSGKKNTVRRGNRNPQSREKKPEYRDITNTQFYIRQTSSRKTEGIVLDDIFLSDEAVKKFKSDYFSTRSTHEALLDGARTRSCLSRILFTTIQQDTLALLRLVISILNDIDVDLLNDLRMEERISWWRQNIQRARLELPEIRASVESFFRFLRDEGVSPEQRDDGAAQMEDNRVLHETQALLLEIDKTIERLNSASDALGASITVLNSRRSIDETHAVTRLTELAFIFIPLSFASTVFGMQVEQLAQPAPLWTFFVVAAAATTFSYLLRLAIRSHWLGGVKVATASKIRVYAEKQGIPTETRSISLWLFLRWSGSSLLRIINVWSKDMDSWVKTRIIVRFIVVVAVLLAAPVALLWTHSLDRGVQIALTIAIVLFTNALVGMMVWKLAGVEYKKAIVKSVKDTLSTVPPKFIGSFCLLQIIVIVSFAVIWTRPLAGGINAALTVFLVLLELVGSFLCWALWKVRPRSPLESNGRDGDVA